MDWLIPRKLFSIEVSGQVIPNNISSVINNIIPQWNILNFLFLIQSHPCLQPMGIRKNPNVIKITTQKWKTRTMSAISYISLRWFRICHVLLIVRAFSYHHLLKSLRVAITTNHISLNLPNNDASLRNWWYLSIPQLVLIIFGLGIFSNTLFIFYGQVSKVHTSPTSRWHWTHFIG